MRVSRIGANIRLSILLAACAVLGGCGPARPVDGITVIPHPDGALYVGDRVSFEVLSPSGLDTTGHRVEVAFEGRSLGEAGFAPYGLGSRTQATLWWVWDTRDLKPGRYTLTFTDLPDGGARTETFALHPASSLPPPEPEAHWTSTTTVCCTIYYITGTEAERDISSLSLTADRQSAEVSAQMGTSLKQPVDVILMPRVLGHGGFTLNGVYVSYLDRDYIDNQMDILLHHEFVHFYDGQAGGNYHPSIFQEGLAVYLTGGHFKPEPLGPRAAALLDLNMYIPLQALADDFYHQQHEIGYLEAGALVRYLVTRYGWGSFNEFYREIPAPDGSGPSQVIDASLREHFGISFTGLETGFLGDLRSQTVSEAVRSDLRVTVDFFDRVRRYQQALDPSAYFLTAWMPDASIMRQRGIVADFLRHPQGFDHRLIETLLIRANRELLAGDYAGTERTLKWIQWILDLIAP